jgi:8-oxo-dGTP pyrophosphatase MutT (NUDIX family)
MIIIASGPVIVEGRKVLVNKHGDTPFWKFCGGRLESMDTTLVEACRREAKEEMGIDLEMLSQDPSFFYTTKETPEGIVDVILVHYLAKRVGEIKPGDDIREWKWLPIDRLESEDLAPNIKPMLREFGFLE